MALPKVFLGQFQSNERSMYVPGSKVQSYETLEKIAYRAFRRDAGQELLHFHLQDGGCEGQAIAFLWDEGAYTEDANDGILSVFAHFESKDSSRIENNKNISNAEVTAVHRQQSNAYTELEAHGQRWNQSTGASAESFVKQEDQQQNAGGVDKPIPVFSDTDEELGDSENDLDMPEARPKVTKGRLSRTSSATTRANTLLPRYDPRIHPALPAGLNADTWEQDFRKARASLNFATEAHKKKIAQALLIGGGYGIDAPTPCHGCVKRGKKCRIYHPLVYSWKSFRTYEKGRSLKGVCAECRKQTYAGGCQVERAD